MLVCVWQFSLPTELLKIAIALRSVEKLMFFADLDLDVLTLESNDLSVIMWSARSIDIDMTIRYRWTFWLVTGSLLQTPNTPNWTEYRLNIATGQVCLWCRSNFGMTRFERNWELKKVIKLWVLAPNIVNGAHWAVPKWEVFYCAHSCIVWQNFARFSWSAPVNLLTEKKKIELKYYGHSLFSRQSAH